MAQELPARHCAAVPLERVEFLIRERDMVTFSICGRAAGAFALSAADLFLYCHLKFTLAWKTRRARTRHQPAPHLKPHRRVCHGPFA